MKYHKVMIVIAVFVLILYFTNAQVEVENLNFGESISSVKPMITDEFSILNPGSVAGVTYTQSIMLQNGRLVFDTNKEGYTDDFLYFDHTRNAYLYRLELQQPLQYEVLNDKHINVMGRDLLVIEARSNHLLLRTDSNYYTFDDGMIIKKNGVPVENYVVKFNNMNGLFKGLTIEARPSNAYYVESQSSYKDALFNAFEFIYHGLKPVDYDEIKIEAVNGNIGLSFLNNDGKKINVNWYVSETGSIKLGTSPSKPLLTSSAREVDCPGLSEDVEDCAGVMFYVVGTDRNAHILQLVSIDTYLKQIELVDLIYGEQYTSTFNPGVASTIALPFADISLKINDYGALVYRSSPNLPVELKLGSVVSVSDDKVLVSKDRAEGVDSVELLIGIGDGRRITITPKGLMLKSIAPDSEIYADMNTYGTKIEQDKSLNSVVLLVPEARVKGMIEINEVEVVEEVTEDVSDEVIVPETRIEPSTELPKGYFWFWFMLIFISAVILLAILKFHKPKARKSEFTKEVVEKEVYNGPEHQPNRFIYEALKNGYKPDTIKGMLIGNGWNHHVVENALQEELKR